MTSLSETLFPRKHISKTWSHCLSSCSARSLSHTASASLVHVSHSEKTVSRCYYEDRSVLQSSPKQSWEPQQVCRPHVANGYSISSRETKNLPAGFSTCQPREEAGGPNNSCYYMTQKDNEKQTGLTAYTKTAVQTVNSSVTHTLGHHFTEHHTHGWGFNMQPLSWELYRTPDSLNNQ